MESKMVNNERLRGAIELLNASKLNETIRYCQNSLKHDPLQKEMWLVLSYAYQKNIQFDRLNECLKSSISYFPENVELKLRQIECFIYSGDVALGLDYINSLSTACNKAAIQLQCADMYIKYSHYSMAANCLKNVLSSEPENSTVKLTLALVYSFAGKSESAENLINQVMQKQPENFEGCYARSRLKKQTLKNNNINELKKLYVKSNNNPDAIIKLGYSLAKELEDIGDYAQAFSYLEKAASQRKTGMDYQVLNDVKALKYIQEQFNQRKFNQLVNKAESNCKREPVFIVGLPRSGTTLIERILSSHSKIGSVGEVNSFAFSLMHVVGTHKDKYALIKNSLDIDFEEFDLSTLYRTLNYATFFITS